MCVTFFTILSNPSTTTTPHLKFMITFNRDEVLERAAEPLQYHPQFNNILCGIDSETGTTWLAINHSTGDFAVLTNYRNVK